jgi:hypothetical protein
MKEIGGYFELELRKGNEYHADAIALNTGRNALELILITKKYTKVYIPYFTCDVILEPFVKHQIAYEFYSINEAFEPVIDYAKIKQNEGFLYTNYFGLKDEFIKKLATYCSNLIIDNSQSFFSKPINGVPTFYSCRKFFGVPDGAYVYLNGVSFEKLKTDHSESRFDHLLKRIDFNANKGYINFIENENSLAGQPILQMSNLTKSLLKNIDYETIKENRKVNFYFLQSYLSSKNMLQFEIDDYTVPFTYPFFLGQSNLKQKLIENKVYLPTFWPNVFEWCSKTTIEYKYSKYILHLPIDQRYSLNDMLTLKQLLR